MAPVSVRMRTQSSDADALNTHERLLVLRQHRQDRQPVGFGEGLERVELFQFLGGDLLEGRRNRPLLDIDLLADEVFKLLHGLRQRLQRRPIAEARTATTGRPWSS